MRKYKKEWHRAEERLAASGGGVRRAVCGGWRVAGGGRRTACGTYYRDRKTARPHDCKTTKLCACSDIFKKLTY